MYSTKHQQLITCSIDSKNIHQDCCCTTVRVQAVCELETCCFSVDIRDTSQPRYAATPYGGSCAVALAFMMVARAMNCVRESSRTCCVQDKNGDNYHQ